MLFSKPLISLCLLLTFALSNCSSINKSEMINFLHTKILDDDSKRFTFTVIVPHYNYSDVRRDTSPPIQTKQGRDSGQPKGKPNSGQKHPNDKTMEENPTAVNNELIPKINNANAQMTALFELLLNEQLQGTKYCRRGYMELERNFSGTIFTLRGECHESATDRDRNNFL